MVLGDEYWKALTYTQFRNKLCFFPCSRLSLALVNLTTRIQAQGVATCLRAADVKQLGTKQNAGEAKLAEQTLEAAIEIIDDLGFSKNHFLKELGLFFVRVGPCVTDIGKKEPEEKDYTVDEIKQPFLQGVRSPIYSQRAPPAPLVIPIGYTL